MTKNHDDFEDLDFKSDDFWVGDQGIPPLARVRMGLTKAIPFYVELGSSNAYKTAKVEYDAHGSPRRILSGMVESLTYQPTKGPERILNILMWDAVGYISDVRIGNLSMFVANGLVEAWFFRMSRYTPEQVKAAIDHGIIPDFYTQQIDMPTLNEGERITITHIASFSNAMLIGKRLA